MSETKVVTAELVRFSYVNLIEPKLAPGATEAKYGMSVIMPKNAKKTLKLVEAAVKAAEEAGVAKFGSSWKAKKKPLRDGDEEREGDLAYKDSFFLNANNKNMPGVVDAKRQKILDLKEVYSGCWGNVSLTFFPYKVSGSMGIGCALNHVQKVKDGEPLGNVTRAEDDFEEFEEADDIM